MKHWLAVCFLLGATVSLTGCYYDPGYSYVRGNHYAGDAYYGQAAPVYNDGYYAPGYDGYYNGYYGCCYGPDVSIGIGGGWYGGRHYYRGGRDDDRGHAYRGGGYNGYRGYRGSYRGSAGHAQGHPSRGQTHGSAPRGDHGSHHHQ
jgi:hypothetical protein